MNTRHLFLALITTIYSFSQQSIKGVVVDYITNTPIEQVKILDVTSNTVVVTNSEGEFSIETLGVIHVSKSGYFEEDVEVKTDALITISLIQKNNNLDEVTINGIGIPGTYKTSPMAVSIVTSEDINRGNSLELHPVLNRVPGVFMQNGTLNTNRISIRGIGARDPFGTVNIRAYFGDIPLTNGNGESSIEDLELGALSRIEIQKGPSSSSYGVGLGGTIVFQPEYSRPKTSSFTLSSTLGSYGLRRVLGKASVGLDNANINVVYSNNHTDGYRENNVYDRNTITLTSIINKDGNDSFSILGSYVNLKAGIPSSLNQTDFNESPRKAAFTWGRAKGFEDVDYGILGGTWKHKYSSKIVQNTSVFGSFKKNNEPRPFNILKEESSGFGLRSRILGHHLLAKKELKWTVGGELFYETYNGETFENLYEDFPIGTGSVEGAQLSNLDETRYYYNLFVEANYNLSDDLKLNIGTHLNQTFFEVKDLFLSDNDDSSGTFEFKPILSPKIGINYTVNPNLNLFGNVAHGFSTPTTEETLLPEGNFNPNIKPEIGWNYEIGTRFRMFKTLQGTLSLYSLRIKDLLVSRRTVDDNFFAINAGRTTHNGIEAEIRYNVITKETYQLNVFANASIHDYTFEDFVDLDNDFSGNDLTGMPSEVINFGVDILSKQGFYGNLNVQAVGAMPANDANTVYSEAYKLLHGKVGFKNAIGKRFNIDVSFGANNILDTAYASQLQTNASGFGGNAPRYFYAGLPFNVYGGVNLSFLL